MASITRADAEALLAQQSAPRLLKKVSDGSAVLKAFTTVPMTTKKDRQSMAATLPVAGFTNASSGYRKPTSGMSWQTKDLIAEEIAVVIPIPEDVLEDSAMDPIGSIEDAAAQAVAITLDEAVLSGDGAPDSWPEALIPAAIAAGNTVELNPAAQATDLVASTNLAMADVEGLGYDAGVWVAPKSQRAGLRGLRNADGDLIYASSLQAGGQATSLWGSPIYWAYASTWTSDGDAKFLVADPELVVIGIRKDIEIRPFDQGVITDNDGNVIHNLMQDDMVALRVRARYGFNWANVATPDNPTPDDDAGVPFSVVIDAA